MLKKHVKAKSDAAASPDRGKMRVRTSWDKAVRAVSLKLGMYPKSQLENNRGPETNATVTEAVHTEQLRVKALRQHINASFWTGIIVRHRLCGSVTDALEAPSVEEKVSPSLNSAIAAAHCSNPAQKTSAPLVRVLQYFGPVNGTEFYGVMKGTFESPSMSRPMSKTLLACVLTWVGRTRADLKHKAAWAQLKDHFDQLLCDDWQRAAANCVTRPAFIRGHRSELQLFLDMEKVTALEAQLEANEQLKVADVDGLVNSSSIGSVLYAAESSQMESMGFCNDIKTRLYELEVTHQFEAQELEAFKAIMMAAADQLDEELWKQFDNKALPIPFFDTNIGGQVSNPNDEWAFPLEARLKTLGVSGLQVERTLYERNLYGSEEPIPGVATAITVPDSLLYDIKNARQYLNQQIGDTWQTTEQMKETFRACYAEAKKLDESIWMDLEFLENEYNELMERKLKRCMLEICRARTSPCPGRSPKLWWPHACFPPVTLQSLKRKASKIVSMGQSDFWKMCPRPVGRRWMN